MDIWAEIKHSFKQGSYLTQLIYINIAVFALVKLLAVFVFLWGINPNTSFISYGALPASFSHFLRQPWSIISYMFLHKGFFHLLFNILWLYWFGKIFLEYLNPKHLLSLYLLGGISGGILYMLAYSIFPAFSADLPYATVIGASASVMAIIFVVAFYVPEKELFLFLIGKIKIKYIAWFYIGFDILSIPSGNAGGHIAHLGGGLLGYIFITQYKKGQLITRGFESFLTSVFTFFKPQAKIRVTYKKTGHKDYDYNARKSASQEETNRVLDKISKSGYSSLSKEEKEWLFKHGG